MKFLVFSVCRVQGRVSILWKETGQKDPLPNPTHTHKHTHTQVISLSLSHLYWPHSVRTWLLWQVAGWIMKNMDSLPSWEHIKALELGAGGRETLVLVASPTLFVYLFDLTMHRSYEGSTLFFFFLKHQS